MRQLTNADLAALRGGHETPCISLYQPTHRHHPESDQDPIRYRNLRSALESSLSQKYAKRDVRDLLARFRALERDSEFWNHRTDGLAILSSPHTFELFELQRPVRELIIVANNFYTKPLLRILQSADRYQILCLNRHEMKLYEGNRDALDPVDLTNVPSTATAVLGEHDETSPRPDQLELDQQRFFRAADRAILEHYSRPSGLPLMLAALTEYHAPFHASSHNPFLLEDGIQMNPDALDVEQLRRLAWEKIEPIYLERLARLVDRYQSARARHLACDDATEVAEAAVAGRVGTLLVEADRQIPGRIDEVTGRIETGDLSDPDFGDVLNDLAETVVRMKGEVVVVPAERMPTSTGLAATYRF